MQDSLANILQGLQHELDKLQGQVQDEGHVASLAQVHDYAGKNTFPHKIITAFNASSNNPSEIGHNSWIIDTEATTHMCANRTLFKKLTKISHHITVKLPDGRVTKVTQEGEIKLNYDLQLTNVLYVPSFKFNLISVHKLTTATQSEFIFYPSHCTLFLINVTNPCMGKIQITMILAIK